MSRRSPGRANPAGAAQPGAEAASDEAYRAEAIDVFRRLITASDYPSEALARYEEGHVGICVNIDRQGAVTDCVVERSSGFPALDSQTCRLVWKRARFQPLVRSDQGASAQTVRTNIRWRVEQDPSPSDRGRFERSSALPTVRLRAGWR